MPQDAFFLYHNAKELNSLLSKGKINKINMPVCDEVYFNIYTKSGSFKLLICANAEKCRISLTNAEKDNPYTPYNFCMLLRKHLQGAEITSVSLCGFERIIKIVFNAKNDFFTSEKILYTEIMGKYSNIFLTENNKILGALKTASIEEHSKRFLLNGSSYILPPSQQKYEPCDKENIIKLISLYKGDDLEGLIFNNIKGLAFSTAQRIVNSYKNGKVFNAEYFYNYIYDYIYSEKLSPCITFKNNVPADFFVKGKGDKYFDRINDAQLYFYSQKENRILFNNFKRKLTECIKALIKKEEKKLAILLGRIKNSESCDINRIKGELITSNIYKLKTGMQSCSLENYYENNKIVDILLDKNLTPSENAQKYFKKYNKQKKTIHATMPFVKETQAELDYLKSVISEIEVSDDIEDLKEIEKEILIFAPSKNQKTPLKKKEQSTFKVFVYDGYEIKAGKNNLQNDKLLSSAKPDDLWFHTKDYHSSHIIIDCNKTTPPEKVIEIAAQICAYHSKGKSGSKIPVDYCKRKYVKKPPKSKPGFVIYTDFSTCNVDPNPHSELLKDNI